MQPVRFVGFIRFVCRATTKGLLVAVVLLTGAIGGAVTAAAASPSATPPSATPPAGAGCDSWTNSSGGSWSTAIDWSTGAVPTSTTKACITIALSAPVVITTAATAKSLKLGGTSGSTEVELSTDASLTVSKNSTIADTGILVQTGGSDALTMSAGATLSNHGLIQIQEIQVTGNLTNEADGSIVVPPSEPAFFDGPGTLTNLGEISLGAGANFTAPYSGTGFTLANDGGTIVNDGTFQFNSGSTFDEGAGAVAGTPIRISGGTIDLTGAGSATFLLSGASAIKGTVGAAQTLELYSSSITDKKSLTNNGRIVAVYPSTLKLASGDLLTNNGTIAAVNGNTLALDCDVTNTADGTIGATDGSVDMNGSVTLTNDGTIDVGPNSSFNLPDDGSSGNVFDNDGGTVDNIGTFQVEDGTVVNQGAGTTSGQPIIVDGGTLNLVGTGSSSYRFQDSTDTMSGNIASGQTVEDQDSTVSAVGSFTSDGNLYFDTGTFDLPSGDTLTNNGNFSMNAAITYNGNLTNGPTGVLDSNGGELSFEQQGAVLDNQGIFYMPGQMELYVGGYQNTIENSGVLYFGVVGGGWGGFGLHAVIGTYVNNEDQGDTLSLGGSFEPTFYENYVPSAPPSEPSSIGYQVASVSNANPNGDTIESCDPSLPAGFSISCSDGAGTAALLTMDNSSVDPTITTVTSSGSEVTGPCGSSACPTAGYGQPVTYTATVAPQWSGSPAPTGTVMFFLNGLPIGTGTLSTTSGVTTATLTVDGSAALPPNSETMNLTALYEGDSASSASTSATLSVGVEPNTPTVTITSNTPDPSSFGQPVSLTAQVTPVAGAPAPTGVVDFIANSTVIGQASLSTSAGVTTATLVTTALAGSESITADYAGDLDYASVTSSAVSQTVDAPTAPTSVAVAGPGSVAKGAKYAATATTNGSAPVIYVLATVPAPPSTMTIDSSTGAVKYKVPAGSAATFSYAVVALDPAGRAESATQTVNVKA